MIIRVRREKNCVICIFEVPERGGGREKVGEELISVCEFFFNVMHEARENDDEKIGRKRAPLSDASLLNM